MSRNLVFEVLSQPKQLAMLSNIPSTWLIWTKTDWDKSTDSASKCIYKFPNDQFQLSVCALYKSAFWLHVDFFAAFLSMCNNSSFKNKILWTLEQVCEQFSYQITDKIKSQNYRLHRSVHSTNLIWDCLKEICCSPTQPAFKYKCNFQHDQVQPCVYYTCTEFHFVLM